MIKDDMVKNVKNPLTFLKEENDMMFFRDEQTGNTMDVPKYYQAMMKDELRDFTITPTGTYTFDYTEDFGAYCFVGMEPEASKILLFSIDDDGGIDELHIYKIKERTQ